MWLRGLAESGGCVRAGAGLPSTAVAGATLVTVVKRREGQSSRVEATCAWLPESSREWLEQAVLWPGVG